MNINKVKIINFNEKYANDLSVIITRNLIEVNIKDYSIKEMIELSKDFTPEKIIEYSESRKTFIALINGKPVGTLGIAKIIGGENDDYHFLNIFVLPEFHKKGIGTKLIEYSEEYVMKKKGKKIILLSSKTAHKFYKKRGYNYKKNVIETNQNGLYEMIKYL